MLALSEPQQGQHHDLHEIKTLFTELCSLLKEAGIETKGVFLNADAGFDSQELRFAYTEKEIEANIKPNPRNHKGNDIQDQYFDEELYKRRTVIEHANAWMDSYKALLLSVNWMAMHWMAFSVFFLKRINNKSKV
jgi:transposase